MVPRPIPIRMLRNRYNCHKLVMLADNKYPRPAKKTPTMTILLGPYLSVRVPAMGAINALVMLLAEITPEIAVRDHANLSARGFRRTPKLYWKLQELKMIQAPAMATIQP